MSAARRYKARLKREGRCDYRNAPTLEMHIGRRAAAPCECPVCGVNYPPNAFQYMHQARTEVRELTPGYKTWFFVCSHRDPFSGFADLFKAPYG